MSKPNQTTTNKPSNLSYAQLLRDLETLGMGYEGQMFYLADARDRARKGIETEKLGKEGPVSLLEAYPQVEISATKLMIEILKHLDTYAEDAPEVGFQLNIFETGEIP